MQSSSGLLLPPALTMMDHVLSGNHITWDPGFHLLGVCSNSARSNSNSGSSSSSSGSAKDYHITYCDTLMTTTCGGSTFSAPEVNPTVGVLAAACWFGWVGRHGHRPCSPGARSPPPEEIHDVHWVIFVVIVVAGISVVVEIQMLE